MAVFAVILAPVSTPHVFCVGNSFKVIWVDTRTVATNVVNAESLRYGADESFVDDTVRSAFG